MENGEKMRASVCFGFEAEEFTYSYKFKKLTTPQLSGLLLQCMRVCGQRVGWRPVVAQMVWGEKR